jgi:UDP-N-acetylmuramate dehydrogenase
MAALQQVPDLEVRRGEPMREYTSMKVGGPAELFLLPRSVEALADAWRLLADAGIPARAIGNGSNLLVRDGGVPGAVVSLARLPARVEVEGDEVVATTPWLLLRLVGECHRHGLTGLEWASGIPGCLGGAVTMNAGCHGHEMRDHVRAVAVIGPDGRLAWWSAAELAYGYRSSRLRRERVVAVAARLALERGDLAEAQRLVRHYLTVRKATQPSGNNAGSMFKNPPGDFAGRLIEAVGGKGRRQGDAEISPKHANFIVNHGRATCEDVLALVAWARDAVRDRFGIELELEVEVIGEEKAP